MFLIRFFFTRRICLLPLALLLAGLLTSRAFGTQGVVRMLYSMPNGSFVETTSSDTVVTINDTSGSISTVQAAINSARSANASAIIEVYLQSGATYLVSGTSLILGSNECLVGTGAIIQAASSSVSVPLIQIASGARDVSVAGVFLNGEGANINGIDAPQAGHVAVDAVTAENCGLDCILLNGNGDTTFDSEISVTRCTAFGSPQHAGISIWNATQAVCVDNYCHNNSVGIWIASTAYSSVANNTCNNNSTGVDFNSGNDNNISNNTCDNNATGILLAGSNSMIVSNSVGGSTVVGINSDGSGNTLVDNLFTSGNAGNFSSAGSGNNIVAYEAALTASNQNYFYPPLTNNQHLVTTIKNGLGRTDLTIGSATVASVQSQYNSAVGANPGNVIVLHLTGNYTVTSSPLNLSSNTCVLLSGTIQINSSTTARCAVSGSGISYVSISGGVIDGGTNGVPSTGRQAIYFTGVSMFQIDSMVLRNFGTSGTRVGGADVVEIDHGSTPRIVTRCTITNGSGRGIWVATSGVKDVITDNTVTGVQMDGVDCDESTTGSVVKFNYLSNNTRYGVFIEQSASYNFVFGNVCDYDSSFGVGCYNNSATPRGATAYNCIFCNNILGDNGLRNGSTGDGNSVVTSNNYFFNNTIVSSNIQSGLYGSANYYSENYLSNSSISTSGVEEFFNPPDVAGYFYIRDSHSGLGAEVLNSSTSAVAAVVTGTTTGAGNDEWQLVPTDGGYYKVVNKHSGMVWNVNGASDSPGATIIQYPYGGNGNDEWMPLPTGTGLYNFVCRSSGLYLQVTGSNLTPGTQLDQWTADGGPEEAFGLSLTSPPTLTSITNQSILEDGSTGALAITVTDAQGLGSISLSATSSNPTLAPSTSFFFGGSGTNRTLTVVPALGQSGTAAIIYNVSDGFASVSSTFNLNVVPSPPSISAIANQSIDVNTSTGPIGFTVGDANVPASSLTVTATTTNTTLVPLGNILLAGTSASRTVTVTPAANVTGTAPIILTVNDGTLTTSATFNLIVSPMPLQAWDEQYFGTYSNTGEAADTANPAGDGVPNLLKYALNMDPLINSVIGLPVLSNSGGYMKIQFTRNTSATDVTYIVSESTDLINWTTIASRTAGAGSWAFAGASVIDALGAVSITYQTPISSRAQCFLQLTVTGQ